MSRPGQHRVDLYLPNALYRAIRGDCRPIAADAGGKQGQEVKRAQTASQWLRGAAEERLERAKQLQAGRARLETCKEVQS